MPSSGMWGRVGLVRTDVSEERVASILMVKKIRERRKVLAVCYIPQDGILYSHRCQNLKAYKL
jgi:hypothetical protein